MPQAPKTRDYLTRSEVSLLYSMVLTMDEHKRRLIWDFELFPNSPIAEQHVRERMRKFSERCGLFQRQRAPTSNHKGWLWCSEQTVEDFLYDKLKNHPESITKASKNFPAKPGWAPDEILKKLEERKERNGIRESEGASDPTTGAE